jgi:hypothetical protein
MPRTVKYLFAQLLLSNRYLTRHYVLDNWFLHRA